MTVTAIWKDHLFLPHQLYVEKTKPTHLAVRLSCNSKGRKKTKPHQQRKNKNKEIEPVLLLGNSFCPLEQSFKNYKQAVMISEEIR